MNSAAISSLSSKYNSNSLPKERESYKVGDQNSSTSYFSCDLTRGQILRISKSIYLMTGYEREQFLREGISFFLSLVHPSDYSRLVKCYTINTIDHRQLKYDHILIPQPLKIKHRYGFYFLARLTCLKYFSTDRLFTGVLKTTHPYHEILNRLSGSNSGFNAPQVNIDLNSESLEKISSREYEVLSLLAHGYSSKTIADKLFISPHTVVSHRRNLMDKFKVKNTAELICKASKIYWL